MTKFNYNNLIDFVLIYSYNNCQLKKCFECLKIRSIKQMKYLSQLIRGNESH
jgi:hypothetical protein